MEERVPLCEGRESTPTGETVQCTEPEYALANLIDGGCKSLCEFHLSQGIDAVRLSKRRRPRRQS